MVAGWWVGRVGAGHCLVGVIHECLADSKPECCWVVEGRMLWLLVLVDSRMVGWVVVVR